MANNEILQIVVFSLFFGVAAAALGERAQAVINIIDKTSHIILTITGYIMALAPIAAFATMAATVTTQGSASWSLTASDHAPDHDAAGC